MAERVTCPDCGVSLPRDAPLGFCPQCLMGAGVSEPAASDGTQSTSGLEAPANLGEEFTGLGVKAVPFGDYELLEEISRGGMGVVYKAHQRGLDRMVAIKMILAGQFATKEFVRRFRTEAATAAVLQHPNIVAIHEVGVHEGRHFFSMDLVEGQNLAQLVGQRPLHVHQAARYVKIIAEAVHYAHEQGVLHRDLKPSNVLVDSSTDQPRITDFGLARRLYGESSLTMTGDVLGSPNFMPPEQTGPEHGKPGRQSDVYGLGAILYYLITARAPFQAESLAGIVKQVVNDEPVRPQLLNPSVPSDLETICLKCLEKEPARRYSTAKEVAEELGRFLNDEPTLARPISRTERAWRWCRRKPALATLGGIALALLLIVLFGAPIAIVRIQGARLDAERSLYAADMKLVSEAVQDGAYNRARELLEHHRPERGQTDLRGFEWRYFWKVLEDHEPIHTLAGLPARTGWEDGSLFVKSNLLYNQSRAELRAWNMRTWETLPLRKPPQPNWVKWVCYPQAEKACAVDDTNATVTIYRLPDFDKGPTLQVPGPVLQTCLSADGRMFAASVETGTEHQIIVWDLKASALEVFSTRTRIRIPGDWTEALHPSLSLSGDNKTVGVIQADRTLRLWDIQTARSLPFPKLEDRPYKIDFFQFFPEGTRLLFSEDEGAAPLRVWDFQTGTESVLATGPLGESASLGFSPDGRFLITMANRQDLVLFDARTLKLVGILRGHFGITQGIGCSPDGKFLATASVDQTARIWDLATLKSVATLGGFGERVSDIKFSADGQNIALVSGFGSLKIYEQSKVLNAGVFGEGRDAEGVYGAVLSPDERTVASRTCRGTVTLWDRSSRSPVWSKSFEDPSLAKVVFSPNGEYLAWASHRTLRQLSVNSGQVSTMPIEGNTEVSLPAYSPDGLELAYSCRTQLMVLEVKSQRPRLFATNDDEVFTITYSPDGKLLVFGDRLGSLTMCERASGRLLYKTNAHPPHVYQVEFSGDGKLLASCGADASAKIWQVYPDKLLLRSTLRGHMGYVTCLAFSPEASRLATGAGDQTIKFWDVNRGVEVATLYGHTDYISSVRFTRDGNTLYSTGFGADRQIRVWEAASLEQLGR